MIIATSFSTYLEAADRDTSKALALAKQDGFQAMGIVVSEPLDYYLSKKDEFLLSGLKFCIHANMIDTNLASMNEGIRQETLRQFKDAIVLARELNAKICTIHPGKFRNTLLVQEAYYKLDISLAELIPFAAQNSVCLCLENMEPGKHELCVTLTQVQKVLERHTNLGLTLDLAHSAMLSQDIGELMNFFSALKSKARHYHISGCKPRISHVEVSLTESDVDFSSIIRQFKDFDGILRIENREREKNIDSLKFIKTALALLA